MVAKKSIIIMMLGGLGLLAQAQATAQKAWTLEQCIEYALANNLQVKQKQVAVQKSDVEVYANEGQLFPSLSFSTNQNVSWRPWSQSYVNVSNGTMTSTESDVNYNGSYGLTAQWTIWNGGRNRKNLQRSKLALEQSDIDTHTTELSIQEEIMNDYIQILYQTEAVKVNQQILESTKVQRDRAREMVEVGTMSKADLAQMEAQVSQEEYNVANAITQLNTSKLQLKQVLQILDTREFDVVVPNLDDAAILTPLPSVDDVYAEALRSRPEIAVGELGLQLAEMDVDIAKRGSYPSLSMNAGINTSNTSGMNSGFFKQWKNNLNNAIGVTLSIPILDNRSTKASVKRAVLSQEESRLNLETTKTNLFSTIENLWLTANNAQQQYSYAKINVDAMQTSYELVTEQFNVGLKDIVDLTTGKNNLIQAQQQLLVAKYTALLNRALLRFYQGQKLAL